MKPDPHKKNKSRLYRAKHRALGDDIQSNAQKRFQNQQQSAGGATSPATSGSSDAILTDLQRNDNNKLQSASRPAANSNAGRSKLLVAQGAAAMNAGAPTAASLETQADVDGGNDLKESSESFIARPRNGRAHPRDSGLPKRSITSNEYRYVEQNEEDEDEENQNIDYNARQAQELAAFLQAADTINFDPKIYFKFKDEGEWLAHHSDSIDADESDLLQLDCNGLWKTLSSLPLSVRIDVSPEFTEEDTTTPDSELGDIFKESINMVGSKLKASAEQKTSSPPVTAGKISPNVAADKNITRKDNVRVSVESEPPAYVASFRSIASPAPPISKANVKEVVVQMPVSRSTPTNVAKDDADELDILLSMETTKPSPSSQAASTAVSTPISSQAHATSSVASLGPIGPPAEPKKENLEAWLDDLLN